MSVLEQYISVTMIREDLEHIPSFSLPSGYSLQWYREGDEEVWLQIQSVTEPKYPITMTLYREQFGSDPSVLHQRQCFIYDPQGKAIGTASAWFVDYQGQSYGRVHWVAIIPDRQGHGFSKPLTSTICQRLHTLGHQRAYLTTSTTRYAAIKLYHSFGFQPVVTSPNDQKVWDELLPKLKSDFRL